MKHTMRKLMSVLLTFVLLLGFMPGLQLKAKAATILSPGDIVLLAFNGDGEYSTNITQDGFSFMPLVNLEAGTEIYFTEIGWSDVANAFIYLTTINDQMIKYTAPTAIAAGTIIRSDEMNTTGFTAYSSNTTYTTAFFEVFGTGNSTGEELLVFQGSRAAPTFIFAASQRPNAWETNVAAGGGWNGSIFTGDGSALPPGLTDDVTALSLAHFDNYAYTGPITPTTTADWKTRIGNPSNWTGNDTTPTILSSGSYTVTDAPPLTVPPTVTSVSPTSGSTAGGTSVTIAGTNFAGVTGVTFGGTAATSYTVNSETEITATAPAKTTAGEVNVVVATAGGTSANGAGSKFTYVTPNTAPSDITLSNLSLQATATGANATVGTLSTTDAEGGTFTYELVSGDGATNNGSFNISDNALRTNSALAAGSYSVRIRTTDSASATYEEAFTITVTAAANTTAVFDFEANTTPTATGNVASSTVTQTVNDHILNIVSTGGKFVVGDEVNLVGDFAGLDGDIVQFDLWEGGSPNSTRVRISLQSGYAFNLNTFGILDNNNDAHGSESIMLVSSKGNTYDVSSNITYTPDYGSVVIDVSSNAGFREITYFDLYANEKSMWLGLDNISLTNITQVDNTAPTDITLSNSTLTTAATGDNATVGTLSTTDAEGGTFTYELVSGDGATNNGSFNISDNALRTNSALAAGSYSVRIRTTDSASATYEEAFPITVTDSTAPTLSSASASDITTTTAKLNFTSDEAGTYYYLIYSSADLAPDAATVEAQGTAVARGSGAASSGSHSVAVSGLTASTAYKAYVIVKDASGIRSNVATIELTTVDAVGITLGNSSLAGSTYYYNTATVAGTGIKTILVSFTSNVTAGDQIILPTAPTGFTVSATSNDYSKRINLDDGITAADIQAYIRGIGFTVASGRQSVKITVTTDNIQYDTFYNEATGHYYQYVPDTASYWTTAYANAKNMTYMGRTGYLATVTSEEEDVFINSLFGGQTGWLGGTILKNNGIAAGGQHYTGFDITGVVSTGWYWACGPEIGTTFFDINSMYPDYDDATNAAIVDNRNTTYYNWTRGNAYEPNNQTATASYTSGTYETCLTTLTVDGYTGKYGTEFTWNDVALSGVGSGDWDAKGYFVEYGDLLTGDSGSGSTAYASDNGSLTDPSQVELTTVNWLDASGYTCGVELPVSARMITIEVDTGHFIVPSLGSALTFLGGTSGTSYISAYSAATQYDSAVFSFTDVAAAEALLSSIVYTVDGPKVQNITATSSSVSPISGDMYYGGHFYRFVKPGTSLDWMSAALAAGGTTDPYFGGRGYLATATSQAENSILLKLTDNGGTVGDHWYDAWLGGLWQRNTGSISSPVIVRGIDGNEITYANLLAATSEQRTALLKDYTVTFNELNMSNSGDFICNNSGTILFYWLDGPEAGQEIQNNTSDYAPWHASSGTQDEPNGGDFIYTGYSGAFWDDLGAYVNDSNPDAGYQKQSGYLVEFSGHDGGSTDGIVKSTSKAVSESRAPILTGGTVSRTGTDTATVRFTSDEAGQYYYEIVAHDDSAPTVNTSGAGTSCGTSETTIILTTLTAGAKDIYIKVKDAAGNVSNVLKLEIPDAVYTATVNVYKNDTLADAPGTVELKQSGAVKYTATSGLTGVYTASAVNGTYDVFIDGKDTGTDITISGAANNTTINYYTVSFSVSNAGYASGSTISATPDGTTTITSGSAVLAGVTVEITASGAGAASGSYTYAWTGSGTDSQTSAAVSVTVNQAVNVACTVTGVGATPTNVALNNSTVAENSTIGTVVGMLSTTDADSGDTFLYTLVSGTGSDDNTSFTIEGNSLKLDVSPDFETKSSYSIRIRATDSSSLWYEKTFTITITNVNEAPTVTSTATADFAENGTGTVYTATGSDVDASDTRTYSISGTDAALFNIDANSGVVTFKAAPNFEDPKDSDKNNTYVFTVTVTDAGNLTGTKDVTITVTNVNEAPTVTSSEAADFAENGTGTVYTATGSDVDASSTLTYSISGTDAALFNINTSSGAVTFKAAPNYEDPQDDGKNNTYVFTVTVTDNGGLMGTKGVTITVTNVNEAPTDIALSKNSIDENETIGTVVGTLSTTDIDANESHNYTLVSGTGSTDNASFTIVENSLKLAVSPNFETKDSYSIRVRTTDSGSLWYEKTFTITITDVNETPTDIALGNDTINENVAIGTVVGTLSTTDTDSGDTFSYTLVSGTGSGDNTSFTISGDSLKLAVSPDFEAKDSYSIRVRTTDSGSLWFEKTFTIAITNVNEVPTDIALGNNTISENVAIGTVVGTFSTTDIDVGDSHSYTLVSDTDSDDNASFTIDGNSLKLAVSPDFETKGSYRIRVKTTDSGSLWFEKTFTIAITNENEAPVVGTNSVLNIQEDAAAASLEGLLITNDVDSATLTYTISVAPAKGTIKKSGVTAGTFTQADINNGTVTYTPNLNANGSDSFKFAVSDGSLATAEQTFNITITAVNDAPYAYIETATIYEDTAITDGSLTDCISEYDGDSVTYILVDGAAGGTVNLNSDGSYTYLPNKDFNGNDSFTWKAFDGTLYSEVSSVQIGVVPVNDAPVFTPGGDQTVLEDSGAQSVQWATDIFSIAPSTVLLGKSGITPDDESLQNMTFHITNNTNTALFSVQPAIATDGKLTYTPAPNANGSAEISVVLQDDGGTFMVGSTTYGVDTSVSRSFTITVTAVNDAPSFTKGSDQTVDEDCGTQSVTGWATGLSKGPENESGQALTFAVSNNNNALFSVQPAISDTGTLTYTPALNANGTATVTVSVADDGGIANGGADTSASQTFTITVNAVNDAPEVTSSEAADFAENGTGTVYTATGSDVDASSVLTYSISGTDAALFTIDANSGVVTFKAAPNYEDPKDSDTNNTYVFTVTVTDNGGLTDTKVVTVTVTDVNEAPVTQSRSIQTLEDTIITGVSLTSDASDPENNSLTYSLMSGVAYGSLQFQSNGSFEYTPNQDYNGADSFTWKVSDGSFDSNVSTVFISITPVNDAPVFTKGADQTVLEDCGTQSVPNWATSIYSIQPVMNLAIALITTDDESSQTMSFTVTNNNNALFSEQPVISPTGTLTYTPVADANGEATVTVVLKDDGGTADGGVDTSTVQTFKITVTSVNDVPVASANVFVTDEDTAIASGDLTADAFDVDQDTLQYILVTAPAHGTAVVNTNGSFTYTPDTNFNGTDSFTWKVNDGELDSDPVMATVTVNAVNDAPVITTSAAKYMFVSGSTIPVLTAESTDIENDTIVWSISGTDAALFSIDSVDGELRFKSIPDISAPLDNDRDNVYLLTITASDGAASAHLNVEVRVYFIPEEKASGEKGAEVLVNGEVQIAGDLTTGTTDDGKTKATVTVDTDKLLKILDSKDAGAVVTVPIKKDADIASGVLTGAMVKTMESKEATLEIRTDMATYALPANQINIDSVSKALGSEVTLSDITVTVEIAKPANETVTVVANSAEVGGFALVTQAVEFTINCSYNGQNVNVSQFTAYVERMIPIPDGVDPSKITTGIVVRPDGTVYHVPTQIVSIDGVYYAKINSLTNSTYTVIWHPLEFADMEGHWAKTSVNNMGSRMVVNGVGGGIYEPDRDMTRAEFATAMVRALGLGETKGSSGFPDVAETDWFSGYVKTAVEYSIIKGFDDGSFRPKDKITREQAMTMIARAMKLTGLKVDLSEADVAGLLGGFADGSATSAYARESAAKCIRAGLVSGRSNKKMAPKDFITRAEVAAIIERLLIKSDLI